METLKVGDKISNKGRWNSSIETIARETKTMWITDQDRTRIYKKDNSIVGSPYTYVSLATQNDFDIIEKSKIAHKLRDFNFNNLDLNKLREIEKILT